MSKSKDEVLLIRCAGMCGAEFEITKESRMKPVAAPADWRLVLREPSQEDKKAGLGGSMSFFCAACAPKGTFKVLDGPVCV
jgi:hypothetical protein